MTLIDIFEEVYSKWNNTAALKAVLPRLYRTKAVQKPTRPYAVFHNASNAPRHTLHGIFENMLVQFNIFDDNDKDDGDADLRSAHDVLTATYDLLVVLDEDDNECIFTRELDLGPFEVDDAFQCVVEYRVRVKPA
jgi:hypothetical protein